MKHTIFNRETGTVVTFSLKDGEIKLSGDLDFIPFFEEALNEPFDYFGPEGYESILIAERPELLPAFLMQFSDNWQLPRSMLKD